MPPMAGPRWRKLLDVMDPVARNRAERLAGRVWVRTPAVERPGVARAVEQGLAQHRVLALTYRDRLGRSTQRRVEPHLIARTGDRWYLVGWCHTRQAPRWFRWDRIDSAAPHHSTRARA